MGLGHTFFNLITEMLQARGVKDIWLLAESSSKPFWRALGFKPTEKVDKETGQDIMIKSLSLCSSSRFL
jgi:N-acetylglutamate synthase-like GNAT family acetyltransferase